jgi:hypothetical protein
MDHPVVAVDVALIAAGAAIIAAVAALMGVVIGQLGLFLQTRTVARTERMKQIVQLAIEDLKLALEQGRHDTQQGGKVHVAPLVVRLHYHEAVLDAIERGRLDKATLQRIRAESKEFFELTESEP